MNKNFFSSLVKFQMDFPNETFAVAVSGGVDSMALLYWMHQSGAKIVALTVDHKIRKASRDEAEYVAGVCKSLGIKHYILEWNDAKPETGIEEAARVARYDLMLNFCKKNNIGVLTTAHQADDQIETFLMNLGRGSGVYGLAGIRERQERDGIIIFRPLLSTMRQELKDYCNENGIKYHDDAMNHDEKFLRVKIRNNRTLLNDKLGIADDRILLALENLGRARDFIESEVNALVQTMMQKNPVEFDAILLLNAPSEIKLRTLSLILQKIGGALYPQRLDGIKKALVNLGSDCKFTLGGCNIRKLNGKIRIWKEGTKWLKSPKHK